MFVFKKQNTLAQNKAHLKEGFVESLRHVQVCAALCNDTWNTKIYKGETEFRDSSRKNTFPSLMAWDQAEGVAALNKKLPSSTCNGLLRCQCHQCRAGLSVHGGTLPESPSLTAAT